MIIFSKHRCLESVSPSPPGKYNPELDLFLSIGNVVTYLNVRVFMLKNEMN